MSDNKSSTVAWAGPICLTLLDDRLKLEAFSIRNGERCCVRSFDLRLDVLSESSEAMQLLDEVLLTARRIFKANQGIIPPSAQ